MEYISYILITLVILISCLLLMRRPELPEQKKARPARASREVDQASDSIPPEDIRRVLKRDLEHVPTPWGWPGHTEPTKPGIAAETESPQTNDSSNQLQSFVDRLFREKNTVDNRDYLLRKNASLRAMVEDRYGRASTTKEIPYRKVKPPRLRDPSAPHDQMDDFPSGKADRIAARIPTQTKVSSAVKQQSPNKKAHGLEEIRTPWGW